MKGKRIAYSPEELAWLEANRTLSIGDYATGFAETFGRTVAAANLHALRKRNGWRTGRTGCFVKGQASHNKGMKMPAGVGGNHPNAQRTQFKKGQKPHTFRGAGHENIDAKDGYVWMIVEETNPHTGAATRSVLKHRWLWEKKNGPVPEGMCLKCLDGNRQNTDPSNWEAIPREALPYLGGRYGLDYDAAPPEMKPVILSVAKLKVASRAAKRKRTAPS